MINKKILVYQKFKDFNEPDPPFEGLVLEDFRSRWLIEYKRTDGTATKRKILKACCSSQSIEDHVKKLKKRRQLKPKKIKQRKITT